MISYTSQVGHQLCKTDGKEEETDLSARASLSELMNFLTRQQLVSVGFDQLVRGHRILCMTSVKGTMSALLNLAEKAEKVVSKLTDSVEAFALERADGRLVRRSLSRGSDLIGDAVRDADKSRGREGAEFAEGDHPERGKERGQRRSRKHRDV
jgi:hypothetical protein